VCHAKIYGKKKNEEEISNAKDLLHAIDKKLYVRNDIFRQNDISLFSAQN
jgi:hypothetical protein